MKGLARRSGIRYMQTEMENPNLDSVPEYLLAHTVRLCQNLTRVDSLLDLYNFADSLLKDHQQLATQYQRATSGRLPEVEDILRSATVLLHASLEDFLRTIASAHLPRTASELLKTIPLAGTANPRQTKYTLSDLAIHCGKDVNSIIDQSIDDWLSQNSFNNCADIVSMLKHIGIDPETCNPEFPSLEEMIARRHCIVHNADRPKDSAEADSPEVVPLNPNTVRKWRESVQQFMLAVLYQVQFVVETDEEAT